MSHTCIPHFLFFLLLSCAPSAGHKSPARDGTPPCILKRIEEIKKEPVWSPAAEITEYLYHGKTVYLITADCCDQFVTVVDPGCNVQCAPYGGFTGRGDGRCNDFRDSARLVKQVWKDNR